MKIIRNLLLLTAVLFLLQSCDKGIATRPALHLKKGERYAVELEVNMTDQTSIITANVGNEKQRFTIHYEWEVTDVISDTEYTVHSRISSFDSRLNRSRNYDDGIVIGSKLPADSTAKPVVYFPLDSVLKNIQPAEFDFRITSGGEITEVRGADSAIYGAFTRTYGNTPDTLFKSDYFLLKSFFGNIAFSNFIEQFFMAYPSPEGWRKDDDFDNVYEMHEQLETIDQDYRFFSKNKWECKGKNQTGNYELAVKGNFINQKDRSKNDVGFDLRVNGTQSGTIQYDTLSFLPVTAKIDQRYEISSGMQNMIFSFKLSSFKVERSLRIKISKI